MSKIDKKILNTALNNDVSKRLLSSINQDKTLDGINSLFSKIIECKDYNQFVQTIDNYIKMNSTAQYIRENVIKNQDYYLISGLEHNQNYYKNVYPAFRKKGISIVPEYISSSKTKEGYSLTLLRIPDTSKCGLLDYEENYALLSDKEKQLAYQNIKTLLNMGIINPEILNDSLKITADSQHRIVCIDWENLRPLEEYRSLYGNNAEEVLKNKFYTKLFK